MSSTDGTQVLKDTYSLMATLWCSPPEEEAERDEINGVMADLYDIVGTPAHDRCQH